MKVTYIEHSGFLLDTEKEYFLFDYYKGDIPDMDRNKPLTVFVSHKHSDHYNPEIFKLLDKYPHTKYVIAKGVPLKYYIARYKDMGINLEESVMSVVKNNVYNISLFNGNEIKVTTLKSTDAGVAYLLECGGKTYYHAGDLNLWLWEGESREYNKNMECAYFTELEKLKNIHIDIGFVPLDPRQESNAYKGLETFMEYTDTDMVFPMHFWGEYDIIKMFIKKNHIYKNKIKVIKNKGQVFKI